MKKQAMAFFSMFSLILMLAIYYITLPKDTSIEQEYESVISSIEDQIDKNKEDQILKNEEILSNDNASIEEKENAIIENEKIKDNTQRENEIKEMLLDLGYECSVEIKDKTIHISVLQQDKNDLIASEIMKSIYKKQGNKYFIEVCFSSEK